MNGNCYICPIILPDMSFKLTLATLLNCLDYALIHNDAFIEKCDKATVHAISAHHKAALQALDNKLQLLKPSIDVDCKQLRIWKHFDSLFGIAHVLNPHQSTLDITYYYHPSYRIQLK